MIIDLFKLHDPEIDNTPSKFIMCDGSNLRGEVTKLTENLQAKNISKYRLCKLVERDLKMSSANSQRLVYQKKNSYPLVFLEYLLNLTSTSKMEFQKNIEILRQNNPPLVPVKAVKKITVELCKIAGAHAADGTLNYSEGNGIYFSIVDQYKDSLVAFSKWLFSEFGLRMEPKKSKHAKEMWQIAFKNKIFGRYLNRIFNFPYGCKTYDVKEPEIIKNSPLKYRQAFALGFLTFEGGVGIKRQVELSTCSKKIRDDVHDTLKKSGIIVVSPETPSQGNLWRFWSNVMTKENQTKWLKFFEEGTEKWFKIYESINGFQGRVKTYDNAVLAFNVTFGQKSRKASIVRVLDIIKEKGATWRYDIENNLQIKSKWAHSLKYYVDILESANIIKIEKIRFGKKKSWGTTIRDVYLYNGDIESWKVPYRPWLELTVTHDSKN